MLDMAILAEEIAAIVSEEVERATAPLIAQNKALLARIDEIEARDIAALMAPAVTVIVDERLSTLPSTIDAVQVRQIVDDAVAALPPAKDGESVEEAAVRAMVTAEVNAAVAALPPAPAGRDADMDAALAHIGEQVALAVAALPVPQDGNDGAGIADLLIDRDGALIASFTDGRLKSLGRVVGKDGVDGETFTLDDFDIEQVGDRAFTFKFTKGEVRHSFEFSFPVVLDRGVFAAGKTYETGDAVTWAGSLWIAQKDTDAKPDTPDSGWRLAVKRGRDGKDAK